MNQKLVWGLVLGGLALAGLFYYLGYKQVAAGVLLLDPLTPP